ncbi:MAG TPA: lipase family protein [Xanthobacteraceae bacterium]|jgi:hypothetical protein|nr:lipase family protein [Xanthobacteraceae bacterium]
MSVLVARPDAEYSRTAFARFAAADATILDFGRATMWLSQLAYESKDADKVQRIGRGIWGLNPIRSFLQPAPASLPMSETRGVIAETGNSTIICFSGTDPAVLPDWIADFRFPASADHVHEGFEQAVDAAWEGLGPIISGVTAAGGRVFFTGHSLGGALAAVAAERALRENRLRSAKVFTFGMPRVGTQDFVNAYAPLADTTYRFIHGNDIVPTVPPLASGFCHVGHYLTCLSADQFVIDNTLGNLGEINTASDAAFNEFIDQIRAAISLPSLVNAGPDLMGRLQGLFPPAIADHLPSGYCQALPG